METPTKMDNDSNESIKLCTLRFNLSKDLTDELMYFSKLHQFDDRKAFKEAWIKWKENENNKTLLDLEICRLENDGFEGNTEDKIFKSLRYYFKKKVSNESSEKISPKKRKQYESLSEDFLGKIDEHIYNQLQSNIISKTKTTENTILISSVSQANAYYDFCLNHKDIIQNEINLLIQKNSEKKYTSIELSNKFKKTYKNRFFNIKVLLQNK